ncbi:polysaccharide deacetylase family protein [Halosimplex sp. J119]
MNNCESEIRALVLSFDTELEWGFHDLDKPDHLYPDKERVKGNVRRILTILDKYNATATWALVGHLFLESCSGDHPELPIDPSWWEDDPGGNADSSPLRFGRDLIEEIQNAKENQDIGIHTFSHIVCSDSRISRQVFKEDVVKAKKLSEKLGTTPSSFVYPQNVVRFQDILEKVGFDVFRSPSPTIKNQRQRRFGRYYKFYSFIRRDPFPIVWPQKVSENMWTIPASQNFAYAHRHPINQALQSFPKHPRVDGAEKALKVINRDGGILHLWAHPHDFDDELLNDLEQVIKVADNLDIPIQSMAEAVRNTNNRP